MPRRWLSALGQKDSQDVVNAPLDQFDFEFVTDVQLLDFPSTPTKVKTNMFGGSAFRSKKSRTEVVPQSFNDSKCVDKRLHLTKVEDSWIGVAFGSPTHPPTNIPDYSEHTMSSKSACRNQGPQQTSPVSSGRYRKFSKLFKSKSSQMSISSPTNVYKIDGDQKIGMPVARKPWQSPNSPLNWINAENPEAYVTSLATTANSFDNESVTTVVTKRTELPKLEIQIPNLQLDRYSVMFSNVSGIKPSNLLERRSRNLVNARNTVKEVASIPPRKPVPQQPLPQIPQPTTPIHQRTPSTYSLFPSPPRSKGRSSESSDRQLPRRKLSFSSVSQMSCDESPAPMVKSVLPTQDCRATPERKESESVSSSPDDTVASSERDDCPWMSTDSVHSVPSSRTSIGSEIFFDLKPALDADGREQSQYIIQNTDSPAVELALSKSRRARKAKKQREQAEKAAYRLSPDLQAVEHILRGEEKWRLSLELNQAIAEVERLTSPHGPTISSVLASETVDLSKSITKGLLPPVRLRRRLDGAAIGIPSPITERSEEFSPRMSPSPLPKALPRQHIASLSIKPAPLNLSNESLPPIDDIEDTPPPVPVKDAKFIPISKFAANSPSIKLVEHRPQRRKPKRSATEGSIPQSSLTLSNNKPERPTTLTHIVNHNQMLLSPNPSKTIEQSIVAVAIKPTAEVSVARTISLERKQSHQILLSRSTSRNIDGTDSPTLSPGRCMSPTIHQGRIAHQPGASLDLVVERPGY